MSQYGATKVHSRAAMLAGYQIMDTDAEQLFEDFVYLAADICEAPIALVALVDDQRQWFKAKVGIDVSETDIDCSVCVHGLDEEDLFIIPDLKIDPRTAQNPWVVGPPRVRFYAGAPLRTSSGDTLGTICVMDKFSRPTGLTARQKRALKSFGRQATMSIEMHRLLCEFSVPPRG
jgi:GAF domain-containing protein